MTSENNVLMIDDVIDENTAKEIVALIDKAISEGWSNEEEYGHKYNVICDYINVTDISDVNIRIPLDKKLFQIVNSIVKKACNEFSIQIDNDTGYCLRRIHGATRQHRDGVYASPSQSGRPHVRNLSIIIALNDDYEGGEFNFPNQGLKFRLKKYQAIAFPPYWTHPHSVSEPINNVRYTINTWCTEFIDRIT